MFVINVSEKMKKNLYRCNEYESNRLVSKGFSLYSIQGNDYYFVITEELKEYLNSKGGDKCG